ncbi:MAG: TonB C-terminal domain-containing protein [Deltaproteobacteria bacterium]|nr:TonB C-terminal domain-containing protein [Deltaproteobacteria bacterium]
MEKNTHVRAYLPQGMDIDRRTYCLNFAASTICHLIFFAILFFVPDVTPRRTFTPSVINVSMVTLPDPGSAPGAIQKAAPTPKQPSAIKKAVPISKPAVSLNKTPAQKVAETPKKWKAKKSLKKETFKPSKAVEDAVTRIEKQVEETAPPSSQISKAIDELRKKVGQDATRQGSGVQGVAGTGGAGKEALTLIEIYRIQIAFDVQKNWAFSESLAGTHEGLKVELAFNVMPNGEIRDVWFDQRSGNRYLDESAKKAVMKSNPVRPHPPGIDEPFVWVGLRFGPEGVR